MSNFEQQWEECLAIIRDNLHNDEAYDAFFASCKAFSYEGDKFTLQIPSHFVYERIESQYLDLLSKTLRRVFGERVRLAYKVAVIKEKATDAKGTGSHAVHVAAQQRPEAEFDTHLNASYTFDNFCAGESNELALSAAVTVSRTPGHNAFNPFFIFGASGVGKTHLAQAIGLKILEQFPQKRVLYVTAHLFQVQYADAVRRNTQPDFINFYQQIDVLIVDDIQEFAGKTKVATQNCFFHIFNHLHQMGKQLIMTCDRPPVELQELVPRLLTRFKWGFIGQIDHPDYALRCDILQTKCRKEGLNIQNDVLEFIARNATDNVRDLEGIINSILAHSIAFNRPIDRDLAERVMRMIVRIEQRVITCEAIINLVVSTFGISQRNINDKTRRSEVVLARQAAMMLCKRHTTLSVTRIGEEIGGRDHSTVLHGIAKAEDLVKTDKDFRQKIEEIEKALKG